MKAVSRDIAPKWKTGNFVDCSNICGGAYGSLLLCSIQHLRVWKARSRLPFSLLFFKDLLEFRDKIKHLVRFNHRDAFVLGDDGEAPIRVSLLGDNQKI